MHPEIEEPLHGIDGIVAVQRGQDQVSCLGSPDRFERRFRITNLTDENDIRVLSYECAHCISEMEANLRANLSLLDSANRVLDWILCRNHFTSLIVCEFAESCI